MTLAIDLGLKRIGLALNSQSNIVTPLTAVVRKNRNQAASEVRAVIAEWGVERLVVGIPVGGSSEEEMRRRIEHFVALLEFDGALYFQDEADSSKEAEALMKGTMRQKRDGRVDSLAAQVILERWLYSHENRV